MRLPGELRRARLCALARRHAEPAWWLDTWLSGQLDEAARAEVAAARQAAVRALAAALATAPDHAEVIAGRALVARRRAAVRRPCGRKRRELATVSCDMHE